MGCDIHSIVQVRQTDGSWRTVNNLFPLDEEFKKYYKRENGDEPFDFRHYGMFGFLANVRNYSEVTPLDNPRGLPDDFYYSEDEDYLGDHSFSWFTLSELLNVDYNKSFFDKRESFPKEVTLREFLPDRYFSDIEIMKKLDPNPDNIRVVFGFDN